MSRYIESNGYDVEELMVSKCIQNFRPSLSGIVKVRNSNESKRSKRRKEKGEILL